MLRHSVEIYRTPDGREPFMEWLRQLRDVKARARIRNRIARIEEFGAFGDSEPVGEGVFELRFFFGPGYRVYYGQTGQTIILLLCGGDKQTQDRGIRRAKRLFNEYRGQQT